MWVGNERHVGAGSFMVFSSKPFILVLVGRVEKRRHTIKDKPRGPGVGSARVFFL